MLMNSKNHFSYTLKIKYQGLVIEFDKYVKIYNFNREQKLIMYFML